MNLKEMINKTGYYRVKVIPQQPKTELRQVMADGTLKIAVKAIPEKGRANQALLDYLVDELGVKSSRLRISAGLTHRHKVIYVDLGV